jgi:hypothetical protein
MAVMNLSTQHTAPAELSVAGLGKAFGDTVVLAGIDPLARYGRRLAG